jgi:hypothetical protein
MSTDNLESLRAMSLEALISSPEMEFEFGGELEESFPDADPEFVDACIYLGTEFIVDRKRGGPEEYEKVSEINSDEWLFALGWKILYDEVIMNTAQSIFDLLNRQDAKDTQLLFLKRTLEKAIRDGVPWTVQDRLDPLESVVGEKTRDALKRLIGKFPAMPGNDGPIRSLEQVQAIFLFVSDVC